MIRTYKYRIYPNKAQDVHLDFMLWMARQIYNTALDMRISHYEATGETLGWMTIRNVLGSERKLRSDDWGRLPYASLDDTVRRMHKAYEAFFRRVKNGDAKPGFPKFKGRRHFKSVGFHPRKHAIETTSDGWAKLHLTGCENIRLRLHRPLLDDTIIKWIVIKREKSGKWFACLQCELPDTEPLLHPGPTIGIDIGLVFALALSNGETVPCPQWYQDGQRRRRVLMRKLDRQRRANNPDCYNENGTVKEGRRPVNKSNRMRETERLIARHEVKFAQQRWYFWHTITDWLTREYSLIAIEDLTLDFMLKNKRLAMHAHNAGFGKFWQMLEYKCAERGVKLIKVNPAYTSQACSECGTVAKENRKTQANFCCVACGHTENADINAAKNILNAALYGAV